MLDKVILMIASLHCIPTSEISGSSNLRDDLGFDSLDEVQIAIAVKDTFNLNLPEQEFDKIKTVGDLAAAVEKLHQKTYAGNVSQS